jgi:hypothetical protein
MSEKFSKNRPDYPLCAPDSTLPVLPFNLLLLRLAHRGVDAQRRVRI